MKIYEKSCSVVKEGDTFSDTFPTAKSSKQGYCISPSPFKIYILGKLEKRRSILASMDIEMNDVCLRTLLFTDDQGVLASDERDIHYMLEKLTGEY